VETRRSKAKWKEKEQVWSLTPTNSTSDSWGVAEGDHWCVALDEKLFTTFYAMSRGTWLSMEGGIKVTIDVHSVLKGSVDKECSTCRLLVFIDRLLVPDLLSFLCYTTVSTSDGSHVSLGPHQGTHPLIVACEHASHHLERGFRD
jgi:hypothetical protein